MCKLKTFPLAFILSLMSICQPLYAGQSLSKHESNLLTKVEQQSTEQMNLLQRVSNINSGTQNSAGVLKVSMILAPEFEALGFTPKWIEHSSTDKRADHLFLFKQGSKGKKILLLGHLDTVYPETSTFKTCREEQGKLIGPGVFDMKGGVLMGLYALKALESTDALKDASITFALMADEEHAGQPYANSRGPLIELAKQHDIALGLEFNTSLDKIVTARRGITDWQLMVEAKTGHSSKIHTQQQGHGAIFEITRLLNQSRESLSALQGLSFNPGVIAGGTELLIQKNLLQVNGVNNVVASQAIATGDLRFMSPEQLSQAQVTLQSIISAPILQGKATIRFKTEYYPSMVHTEAHTVFLKTISACNQKLGLPAVTAYDPVERGAADTSFIAEHVLTVDGLGAIGDNAHAAEQEYIDKSKMILATKRLALLLNAILAC